MEKIKIIFLVAFLVVAISGQAQDRYAVHFKFKPQDRYSLNQPEEFLTVKSLERRARQGLALDSLDLPVSKRYISQILPEVERVLYSTNWLNAAVVELMPEKVNVLEGLEFVEKVNFVAPGKSNARLAPNGKGKSGFSYEGSEAASMNNATFQNDLIGIDKMHEEGFKGRGVTIGVFDAGFPGVNTIPAFASIFNENRLIGTRNFVQTDTNDVFTLHQHGTNVLSLIAANDPDRLISGAPEANYILCITEDVPTEYRIEEYNWVKAAEFADSLGVDIINSSLGYWDFDDPAMDYREEDLDGQTAVITIGANVAADKGILVVTSVGNYGGRGEQSLVVPADAKGILSVGAVNADLNRANFSSQGPTADGRIKPEVSAFGQSVNLIRFNGTVGPGNGTSFSAPQIAALAAGLWEAHPDWSKDELIEYIIRSSSQFEEPDNLSGFGIPDFEKAFMGEILNTFLVKEEVEWKVYPNPILDDQLMIRFGNHLQGQLFLFDMQGRSVNQQEIKRASARDPFRAYLPGLNSGVYLLEVRSGHDVKRTKLMKR